MPVVDASVWVALVNAAEPYHARCWAWLERSREAREPLAAPVILLPEVAAALSRGLGDPPLPQRVVGQLLISRVIELVPVGKGLARDAASPASEHRIRGCDAVYVALAAQTDGRLVTLDQLQLEGGAAVIETHSP